MSYRIRLFQEGDLDSLYTICLKTGDSGEDASHLYNHPNLLGERYAAPYALLEPSLCFILEDDAGACGYVLGALDSTNFYNRFASEWQEQVLKKYDKPLGLSKHDLRFLSYLKNFSADNEKCFEHYPSHLHIDLLPRAQAQGQGRALMTILLQTLKDKGSSGVHLGLGSRNERAFGFYKKMGFVELERDDGAIYMGKGFS